MGLAIEVGLFAGLDDDEEGLEWRRANLETINRALAAANLPPHEESTNYCWASPSFRELRTAVLGG